MSDELPIPPILRPDPGMDERGRSVRGGTVDGDKGLILRCPVYGGCHPRRRRRWKDRIYTCPTCGQRWTYDNSWRMLWDDPTLIRTERELGIGEDS